MGRIKNLKKRLSKDISIIKKTLREKKIEFKKFQKRPTIGEKLKKSFNKSPRLKKIRKKSRTITNNINNYFNISERQTRELV